MTTSPPVAVTGVQRPRVLTLPVEVRSTSGIEAAELAASAGLVLDDWQRFALDVALSERADGRWSAFEVGLIVPRQNGKGSILEARELAGLFLFGEKLILHSAHEFKTAAEAFLRIKSLVDNTDDLRRKVARIRTSHGDEGIELTPQAGGGRLRFVARSNGSGRGFSGDTVILDEAYNLGPTQMAALLPTLSARDNPQIWYTSSSPLATSQQLHAVRRRALAGGSERLAFLEWSIDPDVDDRTDPSAWGKANPALGIRISDEFVRAELDAMPAAEFDRERLGVPDLEVGAVVPVVNPAAWDRLADPGSELAAAPVFAVDVSPGGVSASIAVAGLRADGLVHVELVDVLAGTSGLAARVAELDARWRPAVWLVDPSGPAVEVLSSWEWRRVSTVEASEAVAGLVAGVKDSGFRWRTEQPRVLASALDGAQTKDRGDGAVRWSRRSSLVDISPLVAVSLALWGVQAGLAARANPMEVLW